MAKLDRKKIFDFRDILDNFTIKKISTSSESKKYHPCFNKNLTFDRGFFLKETEGIHIFYIHLSGNLSRQRAKSTKQRSTWDNESGEALLSLTHSLIEQVPLEVQKLAFKDSNKGYHDKYASPFMIMYALFEASR